MEMKKILLIVFFTGSISGITGLSQIPADKRIIYRNLALQAEVTVSSVGETGLDGHKAVDGDTLTRWTSAWKDDEWIQIDLREACPVDRIVLKWEVAYAKEYKLRTSTDGVQWTDAFYEDNGNGKTDVIDLSSLQVRFLKLHCITRGTRFGFSLWELEVYSKAYPIGFVETFDDAELSGWSHSENYLPGLEGNSLWIERRPASSGMLSGNITMTLPVPLPTMDYPVISFRSISGRPVRLIIKLDYSDGMMTSLTGMLSADNRWHTYSFTLEPSHGERMKEVSFQVISAAPDKDTVILLLDDLAIGYQGNMQEIDKNLLQKLVNRADAGLHSVTKEGSNRQFPQNVITQYSIEIEKAREVLLHADLAQCEVDKAVDRMILANAAFEAAVSLPPMPVRACNPAATIETQYLYNNLKSAEGKAIFFGQMDPFLLNGEPTGRPFQSDIEEVCGSLPAVGCWDLKNIGAGFSDTAMCREAEYYYSKNGIVSFCWHMMDPSGSGFYLKDIPDLQVGNELLPGGKHHEWYLEQLDRTAFFFQQLKGPEGESVPVLFRPFHEMDGDWFWWGKPYVSAATFKKVWQFTFHYLVSVKKVNNLLFVFSPCDRFTQRDGEMGYLDYYPGDDYVDILAQDNYWQVRSATDSTAFIKQLRIMNQLAQEKNKISALSETGLDGIGISDWFTHVLLKSIKHDSLTRRITYISLWNRSFVPFPGHPAAPDFVKFYQDPLTLFINDYPDLYHTLSGISKQFSILYNP